MYTNAILVLVFSFVFFFVVCVFVVVVVVDDAAFCVFFFAFDLQNVNVNAVKVVYICNPARFYVLRCDRKVVSLTEEYQN